MPVTPFPSSSAAHSSSEAALATTLVFERVVDAVLAFQRHDGAVAGEATPVERARVRDAVVQLVNELDPRVRSAAEERCAIYFGRTLPILPSTDPQVMHALIVDGLEDYRRGLRQVPVPGVGVLG